MGLTAIGMPTAADILLYTDALASWFKRQSAMGNGLGSSPTTIGDYGQYVRSKVLGDGTTSYPGLAHDRLKTLAQNPSDTIVRLSRYSDLANMAARGLVSALETAIQEALPTYVDSNGNTVNWNFASGGKGLLDATLFRINGNHPDQPALPSFTPTATQTTGGSLPTSTSGNAPRIKVTYVGAYDEIETQPTAASTQVAITDKNSAYTVGGFPGTVPSGVTKIRVYRQKFGAAGGDPYYWVKDIAVTAGSAFPTVTLTEPDVELRLDINPPSWLAAIMMMEFASVYSLAFATQSNRAGDQNGLPMFSTRGMLSPQNVAAPLLTDWLGVNNQTAHGLFAQRVIGTGFTAGAIQTANSAQLSLQGMFGACADIQARVTSVLNANAGLSSINYTYVDSANPVTPQSASVAGPLTLNLAVGQTVALAITAGRVVKTMTSDSVAAATSGTYIYEAKALRTL